MCNVYLSPGYKTIHVTGPKIIHYAYHGAWILPLPIDYNDPGPRIIPALH